MRGTFYSDGILARFYAEDGTQWVKLCKEADDNFELFESSLSERQCACLPRCKKLGTFNNVKFK